jgi:hypothetical protein
MIKSGERITINHHYKKMQMNTTQTLEQMKQLRLQGMYHAYRSQLELPLDQQLDGHDLVAQLIQSEELNRNNEKTAYYLKLAKLRLPATVEQIECGPTRNLSNNKWLPLLRDGICIREKIF